MELMLIKKGRIMRKFLQKRILKEKIMKKAFYVFTIVSMAMFTFSPVVVGAEICDGGCPEDPSTNTETLSTGFTRSEAGGEAPIIKAKWEMLPEGEWNEECDDCDNITGELKADDSCEEGAQFWPTGEWGTNKTLYVCAIATDPEGVDDINAVYADIFYPEGIALGPGHDDYGCGEQHGYEIQLQELYKAHGIDLFCNKIRNWNNNLPTFNPDYNYEEICAEDGELQKETARVYCKYTTLKWEDPAGDYRVQVHAVDKAGVDSERLMNYFRYLPLTAFEVDFDHVDYGNVKLNTHKIINGNLTWGDQVPSVRNVGNTRLNMTVWQDDMGLGQTTNGTTWWNVEWDGRVGSDGQWVVYDPFETVTLDKTLELSQMNEMDFSILINKFPLDTGSAGFYSGDMTLGAEYENFLSCDSS